MSTLADPHAALRDRVLARVLSGEGESTAALRSAAAGGHGVPPDLQPLITKVHRHAYTVTDDDVARARETYGEEATFEIIVSASLGASHQRLIAGLSALENA